MKNRDRKLVNQNVALANLIYILYKLRLRENNTSSDPNNEVIHLSLDWRHMKEWRIDEKP